MSEEVGQRKIDFSLYEVDYDVLIPEKHTMITNGLEIKSDGNLDIEGNLEVI